MIPLAAVLALALVAGPSSPPRRTGQDVSNVARAKAGLLPRKIARTRTAVRGGYRVVRLPSPTFLPDPAPVAEDAIATDDAFADAIADAEPAADASDPPPLRAPEEIATPVPVNATAPWRAPGADEPRVAARGPTVTRAVHGSTGAPARDRADPAAPAPVPPLPEGFGVVHASAQGVITEVSLSLRFDP